MNGTSTSSTGERVEALISKLRKRDELLTRLMRALDDLSAAHKGMAEVGPEQWLNLKGAARRVVIEKRKATLKTAESNLASILQEVRDSEEA